VTYKVQDGKSRADIVAKGERRVELDICSVDEALDFFCRGVKDVCRGGIRWHCSREGEERDEKVRS
jgi:hypothetical protein